ncbi:Hypothetical predicted protein [Lynx pardinus]|uniref:Uncharacterized protein n=1 Tax=Lynx pardinus TaxID=191816 RepID=A0A485MW71_LYNPA|nr:Hypothetical predicted protein [Lynx pardinus]
MKGSSAQRPLPNRAWRALRHLRAPEPGEAHSAGGMARRPGEAANGRLWGKAGPSPPGPRPSRAALGDPRLEIAPRRRRRRHGQGLCRPEGGGDPDGPAPQKGLGAWGPASSREGSPGSPGARRRGDALGPAKGGGAVAPTPSRLAL